MATLPAAARGLPPAAQALPDAVARAPRLRRVRLDRGHPARPDELPRDDVRLRRDALVHDRARGGRRAPGQGTGRGARVPRSTEPQARRHRLAAVRDPRRPRHRGRVDRDRRPGAGDAARGARLARGRASSSTRSIADALHMPLRQTVRAPAIVLGLEVEYRTILVPVLRTAESRGGARRRRAARLGTQGADRHPPRARGAARPGARRRASRATAGSPIRSSTRRRRSSRPTRASRSRAGSSAREARVRRSSTEAARREAEVVILGASRAKVKGGKPIFGRTVDYVLRNAPTRVRGRRRQAGRVTGSDGRADPLGAPDRARHRPDRAHDRRRRRRWARPLPRRAADRRRRPAVVPFDPSPWLGSSPVSQRVIATPSLAAVAYGEIAVVALLRARHRRARRARPDALGAARGRLAVRARRALVRGGNRRTPRDRRRRDLRPARVQRPARVPHRLGDLPRLRDRDRARGAVRAALPRQRGRLERAHDQPDRPLRRSRCHLRDGRGSVRPPARASTGSRS